MESAAGAGRSCGTCTLCCTVLRVDPLRKLGGTDCVHQRRGARGGCAIHGRPERPALCGRYRCAWLQGHFGDADRPDRLGAVLDFERSPTGAVLVVREAQPGAFEASARLQQIAARQRAVAPVRITTAHDVLDAGRPTADMAQPVDVDILPFSMDHFDAARALWLRSRGVELGASDTPEAIAKFLARNPGMSFAAFAEGQLVGAVLCGHDGRRGYLHHLAVDAKFRKRGIGRALVEACLEKLRHLGIEKCHILVLNENTEAIAFWQRIGWIDRLELKIMTRILRENG